MLEVKNITFSYTKEPFIEKLSFSIEAGELVSVLGANGSGKSTLLKVLSGAARPQNGTVLYNGRDIHSMQPKARAREIACIYQNTSCAFPFTCYEVAEMGLYPHKPKPDDEDINFICEIMDKTDTLKFKDKLITELSGGEAGRVLLARALVQRPKLLLLDEAMAGFDISIRLKMITLLKQFIHDTGMSVIYIRHDIETAFTDSDRILAMKNGRLMYNDKPEGLLTEQFFSDIFNVKAEIQNDRFSIINIK